MIEEQKGDTNFENTNFFKDGLFFCKEHAFSSLHPQYIAFYRATP